MSEWNPPYSVLISLPSCWVSLPWYSVQILDPIHNFFSVVSSHHPQLFILTSSWALLTWGSCILSHPFPPQVLCLCLGMCVHQFGVPSFCLQEHWREGYICLTFEHKYQWPFSRIPYSTFKAEMTVVTIATVGVFKIPPCSLYLFDSLRPVKLMSYIALSKMLTLQWKRPWNVHYFPFLQHSHIATCYNA